MFSDPVPVLGLEFYPTGACDLASLTIATVFGDWEPVSAFDEDGNGHTWLHLRDAGEIVMSVDATLHQFSEWDRPWIGAGDSPAVIRFTRPVHMCPLSELPEHWPYANYLDVASRTSSLLGLET